MAADYADIYLAHVTQFKAPLIGKFMVTISEKHKINNNNEKKKPSQLSHANFLQLFGLI